MRVPRGTDYIYSYCVKINNVPLNLTGASITFTVKNTKDGDIYFQRKNTVAGGGDTQIEIVSASDGLILIKIDRANTLNLTRRDCWCDLYVAISTKDYVPLYEPFIISKTALTGSETEIGIDIHPSKTLRYLVTNNSTLTRKGGAGWTTEPTVEFDGANIKITSVDSEFTSGLTKVTLTNENISYDANGSGSSTTGLIYIYPLSGDYPFMFFINIYS